MFCVKVCVCKCTINISLTRIQMHLKFFTAENVRHTPLVADIETCECDQFKIEPSTLVSIC